MASVQYSASAKMKLTSLLLLIIFTRGKCECNKGSGNKVTCNSIQDVKDAGQQITWEYVSIVKKDSYSPLQTIETYLFRNKPQVKKIEFRNSANQIEEDAFNGLSLLRTLHFYGCNFPEIKSFWFIGPPLEELVIVDSRVTNFKPKCLDNLPSLKRIKIEKNIIPRIVAGVFSYTNIEVLDINSNAIRYIEDEAFYGMRQLKKLRLDGNLLSSFDPHLYIGTTSPLMNVLELNGNNIKVIRKNNFDLFPKLRIIYFQQNQLERIQDGAFYNIKLLSYLDLSNNKIEYLPESSFPSDGLKYLDILFVHNNRLTTFPFNVIGKFPLLTKVAIGGNPWQCSCYRQLSETLYYNRVRIVCDDDYLDGRRPICVVPDDNQNRCVEHYSHPRNLYQQYLNELSSYSKLLPICKIVCKNGLPCYANDFSRLQYIN